MRKHFPRDADGSHERQRKRCPKLVVSDGQETPETRCHCAGIVHEDVDWSILEGGCDQVGWPFIGGQIDTEVGNISVLTQGLELCRGLTRGRDNRNPLRYEPPRDRKSDSPACAGNQRPFASESQVHCHLQIARARVSSYAFFSEPIQYCIGDFVPPVVDRQRVAATLELF